MKGGIKNMAKKIKPMKIGLAIVSAIVGVGIGSIFIDGGLTGSLLLGWIPLLGHQIVGWIVAVSSVLGLINEFM